MLYHNRQTTLALSHIQRYYDLADNIQDEHFKHIHAHYELCSLPRVLLRCAVLAPLGRNTFRTEFALLRTSSRSALANMRDEVFEEVSLVPGTEMRQLTVADHEA